MPSQLLPPRQGNCCFVEATSRPEQQNHHLLCLHVRGQGKRFRSCWKGKTAAIQGTAVLASLSNHMFTLPPNTAASMLLQKSLSWMMCMQNPCTQLMLSSCSQPGVVQSWIASTLYAQGLRGLCTTEHCSRRTWEGTWHSKFRVCFWPWTKQLMCFPVVLPGEALAYQRCCTAQLTAPTLHWLRTSQDCLLLPTLPVLSLLQCLAQSKCLGPLYGFYNGSFSITCIILLGLA